MVAHGVLTIVFSSTAATYGEPERVPILETDRTEPTNCYGETKLSMEKMMNWVSAAPMACGMWPCGISTPAAPSRPAPIGEAHNPETHLLPLILQVPNGQREAISIFGDDYPTPGRNLRPGLYPRHVIWHRRTSWPWTTCLRDGENNVFNLGNGVGFTGQGGHRGGSPCDRPPHPRAGGSLPGGRATPPSWWPPREKAKAVLGWKPQYDDLHTIISDRVGLAQGPSRMATERKEARER